MSISMEDTGLAAQWRSDADAGNPAGPLFSGGEFAVSDIISATDLMSTTPACETTHCGTACSGSAGQLCC